MNSNFNINVNDSVKRWVLLDNNHKRLNDQLKKIRNEKNKITDDLKIHFDTNNIKFPTINISDGKLNLIETKYCSLITYTFLKECFNNYFDDEK